MFQEDLLTNIVSVSTDREDPAYPDIYRENYLFTGFWSSGRRVYSQSSGGYHLYIQPGKTQWAIWDKLPGDDDGGEGYIASARDTNNPDHEKAGLSVQDNRKCWSYKNSGGEWQEDETLKIKLID